MITTATAHRAYDLTPARSRPAPVAQDGALARAFIWTYRAALRARSRRELRGLPEGMLKDMGITQADVAREASKPFWR